MDKFSHEECFALMPPGLREQLTTQWKYLAGPQLLSMMDNENDAIALTRDPSAAIRSVAVEVLQYHWNTHSDEYESICRELSTADLSELVRKAAIIALGTLYVNSDNVQVAAIFGGIIRNVSELPEVRKAAYKSLLRVRKGRKAVFKLKSEFTINDIEWDFVDESLNESRPSVPVDPLARFVKGMSNSEALSYRFYSDAIDSMRRGKYDSAVENLSEAIRINPKNGAAYTARGRALIKLENLDAAIADLSHVIERRPDLTEPLRLRAHVYRLLGQSDLAEADEKMATTLERQG